MSEARLQFDDNSLLPALYGAHDRNLARLEQKFGVSMRARGNELAIAGPESAVAAARSAMDLLYDRARRGLEIDPGEVDGAARLAEVAGIAKLPGANGDLFGIDSETVETRRRRIAPRSPNQALYLKTIRESDVVFGVGPAGTGKTYLAVAAAVSMQTAGEVERIVLSRPAVEAGERLGFLPGDLREKVDPYLRPLYDALHDMVSGDRVMRQIGNGEIEIAPLAFMRGRTLARSFVILDEAQNTTPTQMKMFLTRLGEGSRMVVTGDLSQIDLPGGTRSGLTEALDVLDGVDGVSVVRFTSRDVVRHSVVTRIVDAYDAAARARRDG